MTAATDLDDVAAAADRLLAAFAGHRVEEYFDAFDPAATFVFHTSPGLIASRSQYEREWASWEAEGFRILGCESLERRIDLVADDVAVLTHRVRTRVAGVDDVLRERETIVFRRADDGGGWRGVHEHLSADPEPSDSSFLDGSSQ